MKFALVALVVLVVHLPQIHAVSPVKRPIVVPKSAVASIRYSPSAQANNMIVPAILLGASPILIIALIIRAMRGD